MYFISFTVSQFATYTGNIIYFSQIKILQSYSLMFTGTSSMGFLEALALFIR